MITHNKYKELCKNTVMLGKHLSELVDAGIVDVSDRDKLLAKINHKLKLIAEKEQGV